MKLLLDTHILLWSLVDGRRLSRREIAALADPNNRLFVSVVSFWEIAIKSRDGRLEAPDDLVRRVGAISRLEILQVGADHAWRVRSLPTLHRDPFDHLLIAQAMCENMTLVTRDAMMKRYEVPVFGR